MLLYFFQYDHLNDLRQKFDQSSARQDLLRNQFSTQALEDNLKVAAHQAEEQAEHIAEKFLNGMPHLICINIFCSSTT